MSGRTQAMNSYGKVSRGLPITGALEVKGILTVSWIFHLLVLIHSIWHHAGGVELAPSRLSKNSRAQLCIQQIIRQQRKFTSIFHLRWSTFGELQKFRLATSGVPDDVAIDRATFHTTARMTPMLGGFGMCCLATVSTWGIQISW